MDTIIKSVLGLKLQSILSNDPIINLFPIPTVFDDLTQWKKCFLPYFVEELRAQVAKAIERSFSNLIGHVVVFVKNNHQSYDEEDILSYIQIISQNKETTIEIEGEAVDILLIDIPPSICLLIKCDKKNTSIEKLESRSHFLAKIEPIANISNTFKLSFASSTDSIDFKTDPTD